VTTVKKNPKSSTIQKKNHQIISAKPSSPFKLRLSKNSSYYYKNNDEISQEVNPKS